MDDRRSECDDSCRGSAEFNHGTSNRKFPSWGYYLIGFIYFVAILAAIVLPDLMNSKRAHFESKAKTVLRLYDESMFDYREATDGKTFGSFEDLVRTGYINESYTRNNIISKYKLFTSEVNIPPTYDPETGETIPGANQFTVVAFPVLARSNRRLSTFSIREDDWLRIYRPGDPGVKAWGEDGDYGARTWEPIR